MVDDGSTDATPEVARARRRTARAPPRDPARAQRRAQHRASRRRRRPLVAFVDDDVRAPAGLAARAGRRRRAPPVGRGASAARSARSLEGPAPRGCGREDPPITTLDLGPEDRETDFVWGANMAVRRSAVERVGRSTRRSRSTATRRSGCCACARPAGGSSTWRRAGLEHRRAGDDARLRSLARAPSTAAAAPRAAATAARARRPASGASCATWPARLAHGAPRAARRA